MMRGVSEATHIPVQKPKPDVSIRKLQYCEHLIMMRMMRMMMMVMMMRMMRMVLMMRMMVKMMTARQESLLIIFLHAH